MKALLNTEEIIELPKECKCITHDCPHWVHMDRLWSKRNKKLGTNLAFTREESERLRTKLLEFERRNIKKLIKSKS